MPQLPGARIFGVETEFGCLVRDDDLRPEAVVELLKDHVFYEQKLGLLDQEARDEVFEPAQTGGFLINGGRLYIDRVGDHLEYATAETQTLKDLIAQDRAGQRIILRAIKDLGIQDQVSVYNNSVDHFYGHTFGCHENYLVKMSEDFFTHDAPLLFPFLVTRQIFAGVGRVGGHILVGTGAPTRAELEAFPIDYIWSNQIYQAIPDPDVEFQLSQRADHILRTIAGRVRFNRALINPKWEHFYAHEGRHRLHILFGEPNQNEHAYALKIGTTHLVLRLIEDGLLDHSFDLASPLKALRDVSRDPTWKWRVRTSEGDEIGAVDLQREYLTLAQIYRGESSETDWILNEWESILDGLESDPMKLADRVDWVAKRRILDMYRAEEGLEWSDDALHSVDMQYHDIDPETSLFHGWKSMEGVRAVVDELDVIDAMADPPGNTRAAGRSAAIREILGSRRRPRYSVDWLGVSAGEAYLPMPDPFETYL
ncbi:MAG: proteasome accessory factor PafA2 family protein [Fimbriimonadaceae bacterium]|nr:proteasome accessory factor PafA2 family protein [Fimbriimonadaceae bacterium]